MRKSDARARAKQLDVIDRAAKSLGKDRSTFMIETAYREAERVLLDRRFFALNDKAFARFLAALDKPPADNSQLRALLHTSAPWEK